MVKTKGRCRLPLRRARISVHLGGEVDVAGAVVLVDDDDGVPHAAHGDTRERHAGDEPAVGPPHVFIRMPFCVPVSAAPSTVTFRTGGLACGVSAQAPDVDAVARGAPDVPNEHVGGSGAQEHSVVAGADRRAEDAHAAGELDVHAVRVGAVGRRGDPDGVEDGEVDVLAVQQRQAPQAHVVGLADVQRLAPLQSQMQNLDHQSHCYERIPFRFFAIQ